VWTHETTVVCELRPADAFRAWREQVAPPGAPLASEDPPRAFSIESRPPGARIVYEHLVEGSGEGTRLTERVTIDGPGTGLYRFVFGSRFVRNQSRSLRRLTGERP
jgi:hypothetical protein